jgi:hypothetical protein
MIKTMKFIAAAAVALIALQSVAAMAQTDRATSFDFKWPKSRTAQPAVSSSGPGTVVIHAPADSKCVQGVHFKEATLRQGAFDLHLNDAIITACDSSSFSLSYQGMAINGSEASQPIKILTPTPSGKWVVRIDKNTCPSGSIEYVDDVNGGVKCWVDTQ